MGRYLSEDQNLKEIIDKCIGNIGKIDKEKEKEIKRVIKWVCEKVDEEPFPYTSSINAREEVAELIEKGDYLKAERLVKNYISMGPKEKKDVKQKMVLEKLNFEEAVENIYKKTKNVNLVGYA